MATPQNSFPLFQGTCPETIITRVRENPDEKRAPLDSRFCGNDDYGISEVKDRLNRLAHRTPAWGH